MSSSSAAEPPPGRNAASETVVDLGGDPLFGRERRGHLVQPEGLDLAQAARRRRSACKRLRGRDLAPARRVKLVRRRNEDDGTDLLGCVLPRGRVHLVASSADLETSQSSYRLRRVAGAIVLVDSSESSQYGGGERTFVKSLVLDRRPSALRRRPAARLPRPKRRPPPLPGEGGPRCRVDAEALAPVCAARSRPPAAGAGNPRGRLAGRAPPQACSPAAVAGAWPRCATDRQLHLGRSEVTSIRPVRG